ncbi:hypothetical protein DM860_013433 [Cuscuta australis]|uniref:E3 ubiquitin protein ligase n=1 Tax=Cuscuta australis TaxID=267555 RepID=A0A328CZ62_9ASTE|nr:hypothetical protein DM860_013433 [Cuscuta australis]
MDTLVKLDTAVLQHQNQKLSQKLEVQKIEIAGLEDKIAKKREKQAPYDSTLELVQISWKELVDELDTRTLRLKDLAVHLKDLTDCKQPLTEEDDSSPAGNEAFLNALLQVHENDGTSEGKKIDDDKTIDVVSNAIAALDGLWLIKDRLYTTLLKSLSDDGSIPAESSHDLLMEVKTLRHAVNELHVKHRTFAGVLQSRGDTDAKNEAELKRVRGELQKTIADLEESNRKLAILKEEKEVTKGTFFPVLSVVNKPVAGDRVRDKQKDMQEMESTLKELLDQSSFRLFELNHLHQERIEILKELSNLQNMLKNAKCICSSPAYVLVKEQLAKTKADLAQYQSMYTKVQVEKDNLSWKEKEMSLKNDILDVLHHSSAVADSRIKELEMEIKKHKHERNLIEMRLEEASREPGRKEIISEFKALVSSFPEEMGSMQNLLSKYKETAANVHSLRADVQSLSNILNQKVNELEKLSALSAAQETEMLQLQTVVQDLKESDMELDLFLEMFRCESPFTRDVLEARDSEYKAWASVQKLKTSLNEHILESRVKTAIEAEAQSQQKLAATEAEIAELRQKLESSKREKSSFSESLKSKHEETEAYLSEIETIGQAYDDMQTQNQQLLQQITERDEYNIKLVIDGIKARQQQDSSTSENQSLEKTIQETNALCSFYELKTAKIDDQLRGCSEQAQRLAEDRVQNRAALESAQTRLIDVRKASQQQREALEELQSKVDKSRIHLSDLQIDLEKERFERKRAEEEVEAIRRKITRLRSEIEGSSVIQKHRQMLKKYKEILNCGVCHDRRKEVVVTKCYHLFCNPCVLKLIESRNRKCPFCATTFTANDVKPVYI